MRNAPSTFIRPPASYSPYPIETASGLHRGGPIRGPRNPSSTSSDSPFGRGAAAGPPLEVTPRSTAGASPPDRGDTGRARGGRPTATGRDRRAGLPARPEDGPDPAEP